LGDCHIFNNGRIFARVNFTDENGKVTGEFVDGDSGAEWVRKIFEDKKIADNAEKYMPGDFNAVYPFYDSVEKKKLNMGVEVVVKDE